MTENDKPEVHGEGDTVTVDDTGVAPAAEETAGGVPAGQDAGASADGTFSREYVEKLRSEAAKARVRAKRADDLAAELFTMRVAALGRLADPTDLPYTEELFAADRPALEEAVEELVARKPHLADRRPRGDVDQGARDTAAGVDLAGMLRARAG